MTVTKPPARQYLLDVTPDLLARNDDAPAPGRLLVVCGCTICRSTHRFGLLGGRWAIEHTHDGVWTAHLADTAQPAPESPPRPVRDVDALAGHLAEALANA